MVLPMGPFWNSIHVAYNLIQLISLRPILKTYLITLKSPTAFRFPDTLCIMGIEIEKGDIDDEFGLYNYQKWYNYCFNLNTLCLTKEAINIT
jgi:hypothetical protein